MLVFEAQTGTVRRTLSGHVAGVETVKFFPSDKVLLTGGYIFSLFRTDIDIDITVITNKETVIFRRDYTFHNITGHHLE